jgi:hypothetical protein
MMEAVRTSETSVDNHFTRQYIPEVNSENHTRRRENLKSHNLKMAFVMSFKIQDKEAQMCGNKHSFIRFQWHYHSSEYFSLCRI